MGGRSGQSINNIGFLPISGNQAHNIKVAKNIMKSVGISGDFSGYSESNGISVYHTTKDGIKVRVSDHSVTNTDRVFNELHLKFDSKQMGMGGKVSIKNNQESNKIIFKLFNSK
jgi:hypothetical protein